MNNTKKNDENRLKNVFFMNFLLIEGLRKFTASVKITQTVEFMTKSKTEKYTKQLNHCFIIP